MEHNTESSILPVGSKITFNNQDLLVKKYLDSGFTSAVYAGELDSAEYNEKRTVAIKVFKISGGAAISAIARDEGIVLRDLMTLEAKKDEYTDSLLKIAPIYYGTGAYEGNKFLVMELIQGREIPELIKEQKKLPEVQSLKIAWQFFQFLETLHTRLNRTIFDFKNDNFWWTESNGGQLRMIDLGGLPELDGKAEYMGNPRLDILKGSAFIFQMMTGNSIYVPLSQVLEDVRPILKKSDLSWGVRDILGRFLHPNPEFRCKSASAAKEAFSDIYDFWKKSDSELQSVAEENLHGFESSTDQTSEESQNQAKRARLALGIMETRNKELDPMALALVKRADQAVDASSNFRAGVDLFKAGAYSEAHEQFKKGLSFSEEKGRFRDWVLLSSVGEELPSGVFTENVRKTCVEAVDRMVDRKCPEALDRLLDVKRTILAAGLEALIHECEILINISAAQDYSRQNRFDESTQVLENTLILTNNLPEDAKSLLDEIGDVRTFRDEQKRLRDSAGKALSLRSEARSSLDNMENEKAVTFLMESWNYYPQTGFHSAEFQSVLKELLSKNDLNSAGALAALIELMPEKTVQLQDALDETLARIKAYHYFQQDDMDGFLENIQRIHVHWSEVNDGSPDGFDVFMQECIQKWIESGDGPKLILVQPLVEKWFPASMWVQNIKPIIQEYEEKHTRFLQDAIDEGIRKILVPICVVYPEKAAETTGEISPYRILNFNAHQLEELKETQVVIEDITNIAHSINYKEKDLALLKERVAGLIAGLEKSTARNKPEELILSAESTVLEENLNAFLAQEKTILSIEQYKFGQETIKPVKQETLEQLKALHLKAYYQSTIDFNLEGKATQVFRETSRLLRQYGEIGWQEILSSAQNEIMKIKSEISEMNRKYEAGDILAVSQWVDSHKAFLSNDKELSALTEKVNLTTAFLGWIKLNIPELEKGEYSKHFIEEAWFYSRQPIGAIYWKNAGLNQYLIECGNDIFRWLGDNYAMKDHSEYLEKIKELTIIRKMVLQTRVSETSQK